jgi:phosphatidylglycerol:prolipoprotein diacylglycerol transferase
VIYCRVKKLDFWHVADLIAPMIALGYAIVRIGCFLNGCCYGKPAAWGVVFPHVDKVARQPTQIYLMLASAALCVALLGWERRFQRVRGELVLVYAAAYAPIRFLIEFARDDDRGGAWLGLTLSQHIALVAFVIGVVGLAIRRSRASSASAAPASPPPR